MPTRSRLALLLGLFSFLLYLCTASGQLRSPDSEVQYRTGRALATGAGVAIEPIQKTFGTQTGRGGREYSQYGLGLPLASLPFHWAGIALTPFLPADADVMFRDFDRPPPEEWRARVRERFIPALTNHAVCALLVSLVFLLMVRGFNCDRAALAGALVYATATMNWPHGKELFGEPLAAAGWLAALLFADRARTTDMGRNAVLAGAAFGGALLTRIDSVFGLPGIVLCLVWPAGRQWCLDAAQRRRLLLFALPIALTAAFMLAFNAYRFGHPLTTGYGDQETIADDHASRFALWVLPYGLHGFLLSPGKSLFVYSPVLLAALWGVRPLFRRAPALTAGAMTSALVMFLAMAAYEQWPGGWCWGPRHIFQLTPLLALPLAWWWTREAGPWTRARAYPLALLIALSVAVQLAGNAISAIDAHRWHLYGDHLAPLPLHERNLLLIYNPAFSGPLLHVEMLTYGTRYLDIAALRWLVLGQSPLRFVVLLLPLAVAALGVYLARPALHSREQP